jgi:hypothetical protein
MRCQDAPCSSVQNGVREFVVERKHRRNTLQQRDPFTETHPYVTVITSVLTTVTTLGSVTGMPLSSAPQATRTRADYCESDVALQ